MAIPRSSVEILALDNFRSLVQDLNFEDGLLMRFLRARELDLSKAEDMLRKYVEWRVNAKCNHILGWTIPLDFHSLEAYHTGFDKEDRPVFWIPYGNWPSVRDMLDRGLNDDLLKWAAQFMDKLQQMLSYTKHQQIIAIVDCDGITFSKMFYEGSSFRGFKTLIGMAQDYERNYPELLHKAIMINTPMAFMWAWKFIKPCLSTYTLDKITFHGSGYPARKQWEADIYETLPAKAIPSQYGGQAELTSINEDLVQIWKDHCLKGSNHNCIENAVTS